MIPAHCKPQRVIFQREARQKKYFRFFTTRIGARASNKVLKQNAVQRMQVIM